MRDGDVERVLGVLDWIWRIFLRDHGNRAPASAGLDAPERELRRPVLLPGNEQRADMHVRVATLDLSVLRDDVHDRAFKVFPARSSHGLFPCSAECSVVATFGAFTGRGIPRLRRLPS